MFTQLDSGRGPKSLILAVLVALMACLLSVGGLFDPVEDTLTTWHAKALNRQPTGETLIVEIDARSLAELRSWPWPRRYHAEALRRLHASGASIVAFDVDFSARSDSGDAEFGAAIRDAGHVILPIFEQRSSSRSDDRTFVSSRPDAAFRDAWVGGVNIFPDDDGVVRDYPAATVIGGAVQPSIATLLAERHGLGSRSFQPDWAIDANHIPRVSFVDLIEGRVPARTMAGKRVLVGATAIELGDRYAVPRFGVLPGVVIQALAAESLLQGRAIQRAGFAATLLGTLLIAWLLRPRALAAPRRYALLALFVTATAVAIPLLVQRQSAIALDSAAWLFTVMASVTVQIVVEARRRLRLRAELDADSGLLNRTMLEQRLDRDQASAVLVTAAIERFEAIRDGIGFDAASEMIRNAAAIFGGAADGPVYRIAPDLLAWVMEDRGNAELELRLDRLLALFRAPVATNAGPVDVAFTLGMARNDATEAGVILIERTMSAIRTARSKGKWRDWYSGADPQLRAELTLMSDLRRAMEQGRLSLAYQPKLCLATGRIADAEALIRWSDPDGTFIPPDMFIPLAEATGVIQEVTQFALREAMSDLGRWARAGLVVRAAVNISALDLAAPDFADTVTGLLRESGVAPDRLTLEVTESALIRSAADVTANLSSLRQSGIRLSVDDYGTGQSTLSYLKHLPVHELKIDKTFVTALAHDENDRIMVRSTIDLAHQLGLEVVAEGIEDEMTLDVLRQMGCDYVQGYHVARPMAADDLSKLLSGRSRSGLRPGEPVSRARAS